MDNTTTNHTFNHYPSMPMPFSSTYFPSPAAGGGGGNDDSGSGSHGFHDGLDAAFAGQRGSSAELDFDCESEGIGVLDEPAERPPALRGSGSKRSRAAEVHNMSEKRRRSRINEKMKALQNLIPNSNKTDKASMLDEAIEYLKQLQLQVQMLSMRNGLNLHPLYMPGALQPFQSPQFSMGFCVDNGSSMNMGASMLPLNLDTSARNTYGQSNQHTPPHQPIILPGVTTNPSTGASFTMEASQAHNRSFQLPVAAEIFTEDMESQRQLDSVHPTRIVRENKMKPMPMVPSLHFGGQASSVEDANRLDRGILARERSEDMLLKDPDNQIFIQNLHG